MYESYISFRLKDCENAPAMSDQEKAGRKIKQKPRAYKKKDNLLYFQGKFLDEFLKY